MNNLIINSCSNLFKCCTKTASLFQVKKQLLLFSTFLFISFNVSFSQTDTPCEGAQRWTEGAHWNNDGTINDTPNAPDPVGIIRCGSSAETQSQISPYNNSIYNSSQFLIDVSGDTCIDPSTGLVVSPLNPTNGQPIIWLNFDVRPEAGSFQIQINDNSGDTIAWALYISDVHQTGTTLSANGQELSGDCSQLTKVACGVESSSTWNTIPINGADFLEATNFYLAVWDQDADGNLQINNFKARFGCGDAGFETCSLTTGTLEEVCNDNGTFTVNVPIEGINGEFIGYDANAINVGGLSNTVCLTNPGDATPVTSGTISLTYNQGTSYSIEIFETNNSNPPTPVTPGASCDHPDPFPGDPNNGNADDCVATVSGAAPDCCVDGVADDPTDVTECDSYTLPALTNGSYFTGPGGTGDALSAGDIITTTQTIYVYGPADAPCTPADNDFTVTIEDSVKADVLPNVTECDSYTLPALTNGNYFTGSGGTGDALSAGDEITSTQAVYVYVASTQNCPSDESSFTVTINYSVEAGDNGSLVICEGGTVTSEDLFAQLTGADEGGSWSPEPSGAGTYTYTVYGTAPCPNDTAIVKVTEQIIEITVGELVCGEQSDYGFYTADVTTNGGNLTSDYGAPVDNGGNSWTITNIPNGQNVTVTVTTDLQCESSLEIEAPDCFCIELYYEYTNVSCYGLDDGTIVVTSVSEGATVTINGQPYDANMLYAPGSYTIKAFYEGVDIDECIFEEKIDITEPDLVTINAVGTDVTCYGANDGTIAVSNLSAGAVYTIKKNGIGADLSGQTYFSPGMYIVKAFLPASASDPISGGGQSRSYNPCESIVIVNIKQPNMLACKLYSGFGTYVDCKPTSTTNWLGVKTTGQGELTYSWTIDAKGTDNGWGIVEDDPDGFVNLIVGVGSAIYTVTIEDENGCVTSCSREVVSSCEKEDPLFNATLYPNPVKDILNVKFDKQVDEDVTIEVYNLVGTKMFGNTFNSNTKRGKNDMKIDFSRFPSHVYYVKIITKQGTVIKKVVLDK